MNQLTVEEEKAQRFLSGTSRAAYHLDPLLERTSILDLQSGTEDVSCLELECR